MTTHTEIIKFVLNFFGCSLFLLCHRTKPQLAAHYLPVVFNFVLKCRNVHRSKGSQPMLLLDEHIQYSWAHTHTHTCTLTLKLYLYVGSVVDFRISSSDVIALFCILFAFSYFYFCLYLKFLLSDLLRFLLLPMPIFFT